MSSADDIEITGRILRVGEPRCGEPAVGEIQVSQTSQSRLSDLFSGTVGDLPATRVPALKQRGEAPVGMP